ncbi:tetratricopeptide repeat protein [Ekhidna sp. MALMAid0563]|uniref:tetratricopeptide repeat protein n=1 Tax=Ekhidna sp. MALMAid0563 TaxID=3143937 RepID=UPI0032DFAFE8
MRLLIVSGFLLFSFTLSAQNQIKVDSLIQAYEGAESVPERIETLIEISKLFQRESYQKAIEYGQEAYNLASANNLNKYEAEASRNIAVIYYAMGDYKSATENYLNALKYYDLEQDTAGLVVINNNLGAIYDRLQDYENALTYFFEASDLLNRMQPDEQVSLRRASVFNNIGNVYQTNGDISSAAQYYEKALSIAQEAGIGRVEGIALNNLGKLYLVDIGDYDKAIEYLNKGLEVRIAEGDKAEISKSYNVLSSYYLTVGELEKAKESVETSIALSQEIGSLESQIYSYSTLSEIEREMDNYKAALDAFVRFKQLSDSVQSQNVSSEITKLRLKYDFEKAKQAREHEEKLSRDRYIATIIILGVCLLLAVLLAIIVRMRSRHVELRRKNLVQDLELKNKELTTNVMYLIRKNELINDVAERLLKIQPKILPDNKKIIQSIILDLQREADSDSWHEFELRFNQVHTDFYNNLRKIHPDLSPAEEKLCAFLRLNMSSKEIAAITQQSVKSVEVARSRLRKKLNLTNTASNLITYLSSL